MKEKTIEKIKKIILFIVNPRLLLCVGLAWMITNGWAYIFVGVGTVFEIGWMITVGTAYLAFLWVPFTPEKIATMIIAISLLKFLFPKDEHTLAILKDMFEKLKAQWIKKQNKKKNKEK